MNYKFKIPKFGYFLETLMVNGKKIFERMVKKKYQSIGEKKKKGGRVKKI